MPVIKEYVREGAVLDVEASDLDATMAIAADCLRRTRGRPVKYADTKEGLEQFVEGAVRYFEHIRQTNAEVDGKPLVADVESFCNWQGITRETLSQYSKRSQAWRDAVAMIKQCITSAKKQLLMTGRMPPVVGIFDLVNNDVYRNVSEFHVTAEPVAEKDKPRLSVDEIEHYVDGDEEPIELPE